MCCSRNTPENDRRHVEASLRPGAALKAGLVPPKLYAFGVPDRLRPCETQFDTSRPRGVLPVQHSRATPAIRAIAHARPTLPSLDACPAHKLLCRHHSRLALGFVACLKQQQRRDAADAVSDRRLGVVV